MQERRKAGNCKKGYTTVELVVVTVIMLILAGTLVVSLVTWYRNAQFRKQNEYAQTIFSAAQNRLSEYSYSGYLSKLESLMEDNGAKSIDEELENGELIGNDGKKYRLDEVWYESEGKGTKAKKYQGTIYSLIGTPDDYKAYKSGSWAGSLTKEQKLTNALYQMLETYIYDTSIFSGGTVCVEFSASDGQVFAAMYSDKQKDFVYKTPDPKAEKTIDIRDREYSRRKGVMLGYYGVDTMAKATSPNAEKPVISEVRLNNADTLNLSFRLTKAEEAWNQLTYQLDIYNAASNNLDLTIMLNAQEGAENGKYMWPDAYNQKKQVLGTVTRYWYDKKGKSTAKTLGEYKFYLYVEENGTVHLVLDAADLDATTQTYIESYDGNGIGTESYSRPSYPGMGGAAEEMSDGCSFHRFGLSAEKIYCKIKGSGTGYKPTALKKSNTADVYYGDESTSVTREDETTWRYEIANARHLFNMRYIEDIDTKYAGLFKGNEQELKEYAYNVPEKITWLLTKDIDWKTLAKSKLLFRGGTVEETNTDFPSICSLREDSVFETKGYTSKNWRLEKDNHTIKGLTVTSQTNDSLKLKGSGKEITSTGLFLENRGVIRGISLDSIVVSGISNVGAFCGINSGSLENLAVKSSSDSSGISGKQKLDSSNSYIGGENVGGIFGAQDGKTAAKKQDFQKLLNRASVTGTRFVGGIMGRLTGDKKSEITVSGCQNYGAVSGKSESGNVQPMFIGGIVGYAENKTENTDNFVIEDCTSSPQYESETVDEIIAGIESEEGRLKGIYVGGIAGYNQWCDIKNCSTENESSRRQGYIFGDQYVGGIVGFNSGPASGIEGSSRVNEAHVVGNTYVGGIVGCNAGTVRDRAGNYVDAEGIVFADVADGIHVVEPRKERSLEVKISGWINKGIIVATGNYAGGITGFNAGWIFGCNSDVANRAEEDSLSEVTNLSGDYAGGIAGYNNGIIGNTERGLDGKATGASGDALSAICYISGHNYVGGIVGYNDVNALVEDYELAGGYINASGNFAGGYAGLNASVSLLQYTYDTATDTHGAGSAGKLVSKPNAVEGTYFVGGIIGGNLVCADSTIQTVFQTDNFLGNIDAKAYAGGFIGYNALLTAGGDQKEKVRAYQEGLNTKAGENADITYNFAEAVSGDFAYYPGTGLVISGYEEGVTSSKFGGVSAEVFVGGVLGYSKEINILTIQNVENLTPVTASGIIMESVAREQNGREAAADFGYAYAGGIIGKVGSRTELINCRNRDVGDVTATGGATYTGALCEINIGIIQNCQASSIGDNSKDMVGGICGVNLGVITDCEINNSTVTGRDNVGGIAAENFGLIHNTKLGPVRILSTGRNAGAIAGYNGRFSGHEGRVAVEKTESLDGGAVNVSGNINVGGLIGKNEGMLTAPSFGKAVFRGFVNGTENVGGIVGENSADLSSFDNRSVIAAGNGNAGGIIGKNTGSYSVSNCDNYGTVTAVSGYAGGIVAENSGTIKFCTNRGNISSSAGSAGGVTGNNTGNIDTCTVTGGLRVSITALNNVGGISGSNSGTIQECTIDQTSVTNTSKSTKESLAGGIAGKNSGIILLAGGKLQNSEVITCANGSSAGGVVGENSGGGKISGQTGPETSVQIKNVDLKTASAVSYCSLGGVAGRQSGTDSLIEHCEVVDAEIGTIALLGSTDMGYGGIAGTNEGTLSGCSFDGTVQIGGNGSNIANAGGITGKNMAGGLIEHCYIGVDKNKSNTIIRSGVSNKENQVYTAYLGGIAGWNYGTIRECDNDGETGAKESTDSVLISGNGGIAGGIAGRNEAGAVVTGTGAEKLSTGKNWSVQHYYYINDSGTGGICGWSGSGSSMSYVENHASVANLSGIKDSTAVGGMIGRLENQENNTFTMENCLNTGKIDGPSNTGGFVGRWKYNGGTIKNSFNTGKIGTESSSLVTGGIIGSIYDLTDYAGITVTGCTNQGEIKGQYAAGLVGRPAVCNTSNQVIFSDCINTGKVTATTAGAGIMTGSSSEFTRTSFYQCRNYGSGTKFYGIVNYNNGLVRMQDCFDVSGAGLLQKTSDSDKARIVNSYYYTKEIEAGMTKEEAEAAVEAARARVDDAEKLQKPAKEAVNSINNAGYGDAVYYNSDAEKNFSSLVIKDSGAFTDMFDGKTGNGNGCQVRPENGGDIKVGNPLIMKFTLAKTALSYDENEEIKELEYPSLKSFGDCWGANSSGSWTRYYIYTVSYTAADGTTKYLKVKESNQDKNIITAAFNNGTTVKAYKNWGDSVCQAETTEDPDKATRFFTFGLNYNNSGAADKSCGRFELDTRDVISDITFQADYVATYQGDVSSLYKENTNSISGTGYSTAGTVCEFVASTVLPGEELTTSDGKVLDVSKPVDAEANAKWEEATSAYEAAKKNLESAVEAWEQAKADLKTISNGGSIGDEEQAPEDDPGKSGSSMYASKTEETGYQPSYYNLRSGSTVTPNFLEAAKIPSLTARNAGRKLEAVNYSALDKKKDGSAYTLVEQYYLDAYNLKMDAKEPEFAVINAGGKTTLKIKEVSGAYGYQVCYQTKGKDNLSAPLFVLNTVTSLENGQGYVEYEIPQDSEWFGREYTFYVRAVNGTAYMKYYDAEEKFQDTEGQYRVPNDSNPEFDGQFQASNVSKWSGKTMLLSKPQSSPKVHLELVYQEGSKSFGWKAVLENPEDFEQGTVIPVYMSAVPKDQVASDRNKQATITVQGNGTYTVDTIITNFENTRRDNINFAVKALAIEGSVSESVLVMYQSAFYGINTLMGSSLYTAAWNGFYGNTPDGLNYQIGKKPDGSSVDLYIESDMVVQDYLEYGDGTKIDVSVSNGQSHITTTGGAAKITALADLPSDLLEEYGQYTVQTYPWQNQWYICQYGHIVKLNGKQSITKEELLTLKDADRNNEAVINSVTKKLNPGYMVRLEKDGTYTVIYSVLLAHSDTYTNQVKQNVLKVHENVDNTQRDYISQSANTDKIPIQPNPVISVGDYDVQPLGNGAAYTFKWDQGALESGAEYILQLYGHTESGDRTLQASQNVVQANEFTFKDSDGSWNYSRMTLRVTRKGTPTVDAAARSQKLPFYTEHTFEVKLALEQIAMPTVQLCKTEAGTADKDNMYYDVKWTGIADEGAVSIMEHLSGYAVTIERSRDDQVCSKYSSDDVEAIKKDLTEDGYAESVDEAAGTVIYSRKIENSDEDIYRDASSVEKTVVVSEIGDGSYDVTRREIWTFLSLSEAEKASSAALERSVDLSEFTGGMTINVSVKALAEKDSVMYKDGPAGVVREMELPIRLAVPGVKDLTMTEAYSTEKYMTIDDMNEDGLRLKMDGSGYGAVNGRYELRLLFYEAGAVGTDGELIQGAEPKYEMKDTITMGGSLAEGTYNLHGTEIDVTDASGENVKIKLSDCAGMYMAAAVRAVSDSQISSWWSYEDRHSKSYIQFRIPRVQNDVPELTMSKTSVIYSEEDHAEGITAGPDDNRAEQTTLTCTVEEYAEHYLLQIIHNSQNSRLAAGYDTLLEMDWIYAVRDGEKFHIYVLSSDAGEMEGLGEKLADSFLPDANLANARYLGDLPVDGGSLDLPYTLQVKTTEGTVFTAVSYLKYRISAEGKQEFILVLADPETVNGAAAAEETRTSQVMAKGVSGNTERHEDSNFRSWYRRTDEVTEIADTTGPVEGQDAAASLSARDRAGLEVNSSDARMRHFIYKLTDEAGEIRYISAYAKSEGNTTNSLLLPENGQYQIADGKLANTEVMAIEPDGKGISDLTAVDVSVNEVSKLKHNVIAQDGKNISVEAEHPQIRMNTRPDAADYTAEIAGTSRAAQIYMLQFTKGKEVYYHVFYKDTSGADLSAGYPLQGSEKGDDKYAEVDHTMIIPAAAGEYYPSCGAYDENVYYLGDIGEGKTIGLPWKLETEDNGSTLDTYGQLTQSGTTLILTLPDMDRIISDNFAQNGDTRQITFLACDAETGEGGASMSSWYRGDSGNMLKQSYRNQKSCSASWQESDSGIHIQYRNTDDGFEYTADFAAAWNAEEKKYTVNETGAIENYGILFRFEYEDGSVQLKYASDEAKSFTLADPENVKSVKIKVADWSGNGWTDWADPVNLSLTSEEEQHAAEASEDDTNAAKNENRTGHQDQNIPEENGNEDAGQKTGQDAENAGNTGTTGNSESQGKPDNSQTETDKEAAESVQIP